MAKMGRIAVATIVTMWVVPTLILVNHIVPDPYMDEIFHIPQAQNYCRGNFRTWDPNITTPPGLYLFSLGYVTALYPSMRFLKDVSSLFRLCSTPILRSTNGALAVLCSILVHDIFTCLKPALKERRTVLYAITMSLYPLHWFFTYLYYTDVASLASVLSMYLAALKQKYWTSAMFGAVAVFVRQTNVIWMLFIVATVMIDYVETTSGENNLQLDRDKKSITGKEEQLVKDMLPNATLRRRRNELARNSKVPISGEVSFPSSDTPGLLGEVYDFFLKVWYLKWKLLVTFGPFIPIVLTFICFVIWNGSIVLGAKDAHSVSLHFAQLMYFGLISATVIAPKTFSISNGVSLYQCFSKNKAQSFSLLLMALAIGFASVHFSSIAHPYLLSDNRHYTFYIWRKIINIHWSAKYLLIPFYVYSWFSIFNILGKSQKKIWVLLFFLACVAVLVPAPLIEFRYYTIPIFFLLFHSGIDNDHSWMLMATVCIVVNVFTLVVFLFHPFQWAHEPGTQRFIW